MNNRPPSLQRQNGKQSRSGKQPDAFLPLLTFKVGTLTFALPIQVVHKVANYQFIHGSGLSHVGITQIDNSEVTVIDLHRRVFKSDHANPSAPGRCLIIIQSQSSEFYGLLADDTPTLIEVPLSMIRVLPEAYRRADTLDVASHVAVIPNGGTKLTIFLLDFDQL